MLDDDGVAQAKQLVAEAEAKASQILLEAGEAVERERAVLAEEQEAARQAARQREAATKAKVDEQLADLPSRIKLNVRGTVFEVYKMNLIKHDGSLFHNLLLASEASGIVASSCDASCDPMILFLDRNPESVQLVLDFLSGYPIPDWILSSEDCGGLQQQRGSLLKMLFLADIRFFGLEQAVAEYRASFGTHSLVHVLPADTNGVFHFLGTARGTSQEYRCPASRGAVKVSASAAGVKNLRCFVSDNPRGNTMLAKKDENTPFFELNACLAVDLGQALSIRPNFYSLAARLAPRSQPGDRWLNWRLDGSDDGKNWTTLKVHEEDDSFADCNDDGAVSWPLQCTKPFQHFAVVLTGPDSTGGFKCLRSVKLELYGRLYEI
jgi:hypothetical protein